MQTSTETAAKKPHVPHRYYTTGDFLDLINALRGYDPGAASHTLMGLLRMATRGTASPVEQTALRIAGLADLNGTEFNLTDEATDLLHCFSTGEFNGEMADRTEQRPAVAEPEDTTDYLKAGGEPEPLARLNIGGTNYLIGELADLNMLAYRLDTDLEWTHLKNTVEEGWSEIAAEIIAATRDTTHDYIRMHMIHRRNAQVGENTVLFELFGFEWFIRFGENKCETRVGGIDWVELDIEGLDREEDMSKIAVKALLTAVPNASERFADDIKEWSLRLAAGAMVMPAFNI